MKFTKVALVSVIGMSSLVGAAHSTFAEVSSVGNSKGSITFVAGTGPVTPVDPTNPIEPLEPSGPTDPTDPPTGNAGSLTLDYVSSVDFGVNEISNKQKSIRLNLKSHLFKFQIAVVQGQVGQ